MGDDSAPPAYVPDDVPSSSVPTATVERIHIADWERTKADLLYYQGDVISLWIYLSELFSRYDGKLSAALPGSTPHLHHLVLRYVEVSFLIRKMTSPGVKSGMSIDPLLAMLDRIIEARKPHPEHKSRALILRVSEQAVWLVECVEDAHGGPASQALKQASIRQINEAVAIHEQLLTSNGPSVNFVHAVVRRGLGYIKAQEEWDEACDMVPSLDRDDLYFSLKAITQKLFRAINSQDVSDLRATIPALQETLGLGEWGKLFYDKWWRGEEQSLRSTDLWKNACSGMAYTSPGHGHTEIHRSMSMPAGQSTQAGQTVTPKTEKPKGKSGDGMGDVVAKTIVSTVVRQAILGF